MVSDVSGTVREAVEKFRLDAQGQTRSSSATAAPEKTSNPGSGTAGGRCHGCCSGGGKGEGKGGDAGMGRGQGAGKSQNCKKQGE